MASKTKALTTAELQRYGTMAVSLEDFGRRIMRSALLAAANEIEASKLKSPTVELKATFTVGRCGPTLHSTDPRLAPSGCYSVAVDVCGNKLIDGNIVYGCDRTFYCDCIEID